MARRQSTGCAGRRHGARRAGAVRPGGLSFDHPLISLALEHITHVQPGPRRGRILGLEVHRRIRFVLSESHLRNGYIHGSEIRPLSEIIQDAEAHRIFILDVLFAGAQQQGHEEQEGGERFHFFDYSRTLLRDLF